MAYVNVAEWKPDQVTDWLKGLDSVVVPYIHSFLNNQVNGQQVLNLGPDDLEHLGVYKLGHQELILEAVEYLRNFHYELDRETLQILALRLSCLAHSLHNELNKNHMDSLLVSTQTLADVANIVTAVKPLVCWLDRPPFSGQLEYSAKKSELLSLSLEMATCGQRDRFAERPVEEIRTSSKRLAELADSIIQDIQDPLILQPASLELVTLKKRSSDDLGFYIVPSFHGIHQIGALKCNSVAHQCGKLEAGDEIVQINYQTVVGWQLKQVIALFEESPTEVLLTVKKRPRHTKVYGQIYMKPYRLPSKKRATQNSFTRWHDNLPSPRPELLTISDIEMPTPKLVPGGLESTANTGRLPSSSEEEGEGLDVGVTSSPTSVRLYLPKPRLPVQRRATITGASPLSKRAPVNLQQFWEELKLEREWRCGGAGGTMGEKPCVAQLIQDCESRVSCTRKFSSVDSLKDCSGSCFLQDSKPDVVSSCHGKEKCFGSDEYIKNGSSLDCKLSEYSGQKSGSTSTYKTSSGSEENIYRNCDTSEKSSETDDVFKTVDATIINKQDGNFEQCSNVDSSENYTGMDIRKLDSSDKASVSSEIKNEIEEGKVSSLKAKIELFSKGVGMEKQINFISPGINRGNKPKVPVRTFRLSPEKPVSRKIQTTVVKDSSDTKTTIESNVIVRHEGIRKERGRLDKSHSTPAYDFSAELSYADGKLQNIFKREKSPKQTKTDPSLGIEAKTESSCEDSKTEDDFGRKLEEKSTGVIQTDCKNLDKLEHEVQIEHGQIVETINKHILQMDDEGDSEPKWKDKKTGTNLDNDQINEENETEEKIGKILENINSSLVERRKEMERESKTWKNLSEEVSVQKTVSKAHYEETLQPYSSVDNEITSSDKNVEKDCEPKVKTASIPVPPRVRITPPAIPEEFHTLPDVTMINNTPSVILESLKRKPVSEFDYIEKATPPAPATFPRQKADTRRPLTPPEPPPRPAPPAPSPQQQIQQKGACYRAMMVARSMSKSATHKAASMTSPRSLRKKNPLLAKHRNISVKDLGPCDCQGWLQQRCRKGSGQWNRGWFVIKGTTFYGFKSKEAHKADIMISLPGFTVSLAEEVKSRKYAFKVYHTGTMFYFAADNQEELTAWVDSVTMATLTTQDTHSDTVLFSESEGEVSGEEGGAESCFLSPKMKKLAGLFPSPTKTVANTSTTHSSSEKSHESQKIFGSLKKLRNKSGDHGDNASESSGGGASLDRKYLGFLGRGPSVVPTAQFRSYRRVAPPLPRTHHQSAESVLTLDTSGSSIFAEGLQRSPHGHLQISPGLPANHNLPPDMADYRLASLSKNRRRGGEERDTTGFVTVEALMLSRQEEERQTQTHFHPPEVPQLRAPPPPVSQRNFQGHQNGPETRRTVQPTTQPHMLSCQAVSMTPVTQSRSIHSRSTSGFTEERENNSGTTVIRRSSFNNPSRLHRNIEVENRDYRDGSPEKLWIDSLRRNNTDSKRHPPTPRHIHAVQDLRTKKLKKAALYQPPPVSPLDNPGITDDSRMRLAFEMTLDQQTHISDNHSSKKRCNKSAPTPAARLRNLFSSKNDHSPVQKTLLGSPRLHRAFFRGMSRADSGGESLNSPPLSPPQDLDIPLIRPLPVSNPPTPDYPGLEYPPVFEPGTYSLADASSLLRQRNREDSS